MDEISLIQSWSRYNNKVQALQQTLGLPVQKISEKVESDSRWSTYNSQVQQLKTKLDIQTHKSPQQLTFYKSVTKQADDPPEKAFVSSHQYRTGRMLEKELIKHYGLPAIHTMERHSEDRFVKASEGPPAQDVVDKVLITRSLAHGQRLKSLDETIRKLEATKGRLKKELKNLKAQNEFFGNGRLLQAAKPCTRSLSSEPRLENKNTYFFGTDLLSGLEMDETLMNEIIEEVMSSNLSYQPKKRNPATSERIEKLKLEASIDRTILLTEEEIILEVSSEMSKEVATDAFRRAVLSLQFESHFGSTKVQEYLTSTNPLDF